MAPDQKCDLWQHHITDWQQSKLSQKQYCQRHDLRVANFSYWRTRLKGSTKSQARTAFIPVKVVGTSTSVTVGLPVGLRLEFPASVLEIIAGDRPVCAGGIVMLRPDNDIQVFLYTLPWT